MIQEFGSRWHDVLTGTGDECTRAHGLPVVALHCSGADARQWRKLGAALGGAYDLLAVEFYGCESTGLWPGERPFTLADEARRVIDLIDACGSRVHLVGHSYGGGVALRVAAERPQAIASLVLYEPSAFHLLSELGPRALGARREILDLEQAVSHGIVSGDYHGAARRFVDYWNGPGAWGALQPEVRPALLRWLPKAPLDFRALLGERTPLAAYRGLAVPTLILRGEHAREPSRVIAEGLARVIQGTRLSVIAGAGHMGPFTHTAEVNQAIAAHLETAAAANDIALPRGHSEKGRSGPLAA